MVCLGSRRFSDAWSVVGEIGQGDVAFMAYKRERGKTIQRAAGCQSRPFPSYVYCLMTLSRMSSRTAPLFLRELAQLFRL